MTVEEIAALPIGDVAAPDAHLYLWTINRYLEDAFSIVRRWGFRHSTTLVWDKAVMGGGLGKLPTLGRVSGTSFRWKRPYDSRGKPRHSAKPPELRAIIERVSPGPRAEIFARESATGWDAWGNEVACAEPLARILGVPRKIEA